MSRSLVMFTLAMFYLFLSTGAQAVNPPPDGGYAGYTTAEGTNALQNLTIGLGNTGVGWYALATNTSGNYNTALGAGALVLNNADANTATGAAALLLNTSGTDNTANGAAALLRNDSGNFNTATGVYALSSNTTGGDNTAMGFHALLNNVGGFDNNAVGYRALESHTTNSHNNAFGVAALLSDQNGISNTAIGDGALQLNVSGVNNTAVGDSALALSTGTGNTAVGVGAGENVTTASNVICIGTLGDNVSNSCYIGNVYGAPVDPATGTLVAVDSTGKFGTTTSSRRFKHDIRAMDTASAGILKLKPVTFHYNSDAQNTPCYGLLAEDVAEANPDLVVRDKEGKPYSVRYDQVNAMLLNEFLKEHRKVEQMQKQIDALTAGLQRVSAKLDMSRPAPQTAMNN